VTAALTKRGRAGLASPQASGQVVIIFKPKVRQHNETGASRAIIIQVFKLISLFSETVELFLYIITALLSVFSRRS
jgi:hypothetical protein